MKKILKMIIKYNKKVYYYIYIYIMKIFLSENNFKIPFLKRIRYNLKGFTNNQIVLYDLINNNSQNYISEYERWKSRETNGSYKFILDDKIIFYEMFKNYINIPENLFWVKNKEIITLYGKKISNEQFKKILSVNKNIFVKPVAGGGGEGVYKISYNKDRYYLNDMLIDLDSLKEYIIKKENVIATEGISQHPYSSNIFKSSINTIRILTIYNYKTNKASVIDAVHRFGTRKTQPVDNVSIGGLFSKINLETGILSQAKNYNNKVYDFHPDTQMKITGTKIPGWEETTKKCVEVASIFPYIPYMAWDIVITTTGFSVIEINPSTGLTLFQMQEGKRNSPLGMFLKSEGIIKSK